MSGSLKDASIWVLLHVFPWAVTVQAVAAGRWAVACVWWVTAGLPFPPAA